MNHKISKRDTLSPQKLCLRLTNNVYKKITIEDQKNLIRNGKTEFIFGEGSTSTKKLVDPYHFSIHPTEDIILFSSTYDNQLQLYTLGGDFITAFTDPLLISPIDVLFIKDSIYVTGDYSCLKQFTDFADKKVIFNASIDQMWTPLGLTCDSQENIYFIDDFGHHVIVFERNLNSFEEIDISPYTNCVDIFVENDELFLLSHSPRHIIKLSLEGEFIFGIDFNEFLSFPISFCSDRNGHILISDSHSNKVLFVVSTGTLKLSLITLDRVLPYTEKFRNIAVIRNSSLIVSSLEFCFSIVLT